jgi:hypothetical protein
MVSLFRVSKAELAEKIKTKPEKGKSGDKSKEAEKQKGDAKSPLAAFQCGNKV